MSHRTPEDVIEDIEERLGRLEERQKNSHRILVTKRSNDYLACFVDDPKIWGCGKNEDEAIGDLIRSHPKEFFKIEII